MKEKNFKIARLTKTSLFLNVSSAVKQVLQFIIPDPGNSKCEQQFLVLVAAAICALKKVKDCSQSR